MTPDIEQTESLPQAPDGADTASIAEGTNATEATSSVTGTAAEKPAEVHAPASTEGAATEKLAGAEVPANLGVNATATATAGTQVLPNTVMPTQPEQPAPAAAQAAAPGGSGAAPAGAPHPRTSDTGVLGAGAPAGAQKVWTAADAHSAGAPSQPRRPVHVGQLVWGSLVTLVGVFFIAFPFISSLDMPLFLIGLVGLLGLSLILTAFLVGKEPGSNRSPAKS